MNILYIGPNTSLDQWGLASYNYLGMLNAIPDTNIVVRNIVYNSLQRSENDLDDWYKKLENNECCDKYDYIFQFCLPQDFVYTPNSIGLTIVEPLQLNNRLWECKLRLMPKVLVSTPQEKRSVKNSQNITVEPIRINTNIKYNTYKGPNIPNLGKDYIFYWIGQYGEAACWKEVYSAFMLEFDRGENVHLLMHFISHPNQDFANRLSKEINDVKQSLNKYSNIEFYCKESINLGCNLNDIRSYHAFLDCYIDINRAVNNKSLIKEAQLFDKQIVINCIDQLEPIIGHPVYSSQNLWRSVNIYQIQKLLRSAYNKRKADNVNIDKLDYRHGGKSIMEILETLK